VRLGEPGRAALRELGVRTAIDLREPQERTLNPPDLDRLDISIHNQPILGDQFDVANVTTLDDLYRSVLTQRGTQIVEVARILADPQAGPAIMFCSAGKDRTGILSAVLLGALGVADEDIISDYTITEQNMTGPFRAAIEARAAAAALTQQEIATKLGAPAALMRATIASLRRHHSDAAGYLRHHGLSESDVRALRRSLVQPT
jgi:protein-tyrosine phosphatase